MNHLDEHKVIRENGPLSFENELNRLAKEGWWLNKFFIESAGYYVGVLTRSVVS